MIENFGALQVLGRGGLTSFLRKYVDDPRRKQGRRFPAHSILIGSILAVSAGATSFAAIWHWISTREKSFLVSLGFTRRYRMSEPSIRRLLNSVKSEQVEKAIREWLYHQKNLNGLHGEGIAIDGKVLRASRSGKEPAVQLLSAVLHRSGLTIGQIKIDPKSNEITSVKPLLEPIKIEGSIVSLDAIHTQSDTAKFIVEEKRADYIMTVKDNQKHLKKDIANTMILKKKSARTPGIKQRSRTTRDSNNMRVPS